jgi:hypothetical protein
MDDYFCVVPNHKILAVKNGVKHSKYDTSPVSTEDQSNINI